jgi:hypothetical protein
MRAVDALRELSELTGGQWGLVTTAQAAARGISRLQLSRLAEDEQLERVGHGIYRDRGAPIERFDGLKAAWLSLDPKRTAHERMQSKPADAVVSGPAASYLLGLGDLAPEPYQFTVPIRRQTQRDSVAFRVRKLPPASVTIREGLPVTTPEQTIADLVEERQDLSLVADVFADTASLDSDQLSKLLSPLAQRNGFSKGNGAAFYAELEKLAHRDVDSLAKAVSGTPLGAKIAEEYFRALDPSVLEVIAGSFRAQVEQVLAGITRPPEMGERLAAAGESLAGQLAELIGAALDAICRQVAEAAAVPMRTLESTTRRQLIDAAAGMRPAVGAFVHPDSRFARLAAPERPGSPGLVYGS